MSLDAGDRSDSWLGVPADPAIMDQPDGDRVEIVELGSTLLVGVHQTGLLENVQMVHDAKPGPFAPGGK